MTTVLLKFEKEYYDPDTKEEKIIEGKVLYDQSEYKLHFYDNNNNSLFILDIFTNVNLLKDHDKYKFSFKLEDNTKISIFNDDKNDTLGRRSWKIILAKIENNSRK